MYVVSYRGFVTQFHLWRDMYKSYSIIDKDKGFRLLWLVYCYDLSFLK